MSSQSASLPEPILPCCLDLAGNGVIHEVCGKIIQTLALGFRGIQCPSHDASIMSLS